MHTCSPSKSSFHHRLSNERDVSLSLSVSSSHVHILIPPTFFAFFVVKAGESSEQSRNQGNLQKGCNASHVKQLLKWLQQGNIVVLVRDTGTPVISDPDMEPLCLAS
eukprot:TRINITY_DN2297_c1_g1_i4.p2 TRINITY_DN2297_c1_g1~~TRINITY_DN2297_c1_g1_i4.p2  ORF type:complete len:107 (-),score=16.11 TRINITY_DN2297_c1_g1_i4:1146-1466(-)